MKRSGWVWMVILAAAGAAAETGPAAGAEGSLRLWGGDRLTGRLEGLDVAGGAARFRHEQVRDPLAVNLEALDEFRVAAGGAAPAGRVRPTWSFELTNGDVVRGVLLALDEQALVADTVHLGRIRLERVMVRAVSQLAGGVLIYAGPGADEGWTAARGKPQFESDSVRLPGGTFIGRTLPHMPAKARLDLLPRAAWKPSRQSRIRSKTAFSW